MTYYLIAQSYRRESQPHKLIVPRLLLLRFRQLFVDPLTGE
jgi:hypothetical protein